MHEDDTYARCHLCGEPTELTPEEYKRRWDEFIAEGKEKQGGGPHEQ